MKIIYSMLIDNYDWSGNAFSYGLLVARLGYEKEHLHHENVKELQLQDNSENWPWADSIFHYHLQPGLCTSHFDRRRARLTFNHVLQNIKVGFQTLDS